MWLLLKKLLRFAGRPGESGSERSPVHQLTQIQSTLNQVHADLGRVLKYISEQAFDIRIDRVCIDEVNLDQVNFNIDDIGVRDLSGALSIGINYGGRVVRPIETPPPPPKPRGSGGGTPPGASPARGPSDKENTSPPGPPSGGQGPRLNIRYETGGKGDDSGTRSV